MQGRVVNTRHPLHHSNLKHRTHSRKQHRALRYLQDYQLHHSHRNTEQLLQLQNQLPPLQLQHQSQQRIPHQQQFKGNPIPPLSVLEILLCLLYLSIVVDIIYVLGLHYFKPSSELIRTKSGAIFSKRGHVGSGIHDAGSSKKKRFLTLDSLWRRLKAEAGHMQNVDSQHRAITEIMMETRLRARSPEREKLFNKLRANKKAAKDLQIDMVKWADKISADHTYRGK